MMSIGVVKSGASVYQYFVDKDNYYLTDKSEVVQGASWYGKGAAKLGIHGKVIEEKIFLDLLEGRMPNGTQIGKMRDGSIKHRPATDITLSAPKSLSIMALVANDTRLIEVHNKATQKVFDTIEAMYAEARVTENGVTRYEKTGNLTIAAFRHTSSREKDPQLHTHGVTMNATERQDGAWRALSSRQKSDMKNLEHGFREMIYANQHYLGMIYNSEVAKGTVDCGYSITVKDKYGNFEIDGIPESYINSQSKRRKQIIDSMLKRGLSGAKAAQTASLNTRELKTAVAPERLREIWQRDAESYGVNLNEILDKARQPKTPTVQSEIQPLSETAKAAIDDAILHLSQYNVQIRHGDMIRQAFIFGAGVLDHESLEAVLADKIKSGEVIGQANQYYTTKTLVETEKRLQSAFEASKGTSFACDLKESGVTAAVLNHKDRLQVVDVKGLKNEATLLDKMVKTAENQGLNVYVLHQNLSRINRLEGQVTRDHSSFWKTFKNYFKHDLMQTVGKFAHDYQNMINNGRFFFQDKPDFIVVADAQKLSYQDTEALEKLTGTEDAKIVFLNNTESTKGFQAGNTIQILKASGVNHVKSTTQKKNTEVIIAESRQNTKDLAAHYASLTSMVPVVAFTNKGQQEITAAIRDTLQSQGRLSLQTIAYHTISTKGLSDIEKTKIKCYHPGDSITFNPFTKEATRYFVTGLDKENNTLKLSPAMATPKNKVLTEFALEGSVDFDVKKQQTLSIAVGDILRATRNLRLEKDNKRITIDKNDVFQVTGVEQSHINIVHNDNAYNISRDKLKNSFIDHGYVIKPHQLKDAKEVLTALSGYQVNQNTIGEMAEFADKVTLFTDNPKKSQAALNKQGVHWQARTVASGKAQASYAPVVRTETAIRNDLFKVANALCQNIADKDKITEIAVSYGMAKVAEREAGFTRNDLLKTAMHYALGDASLTDIEKVVTEKERSGEILVARGMMTTPYVYALEQNIIENVTQGHNKLAPILTEAPSLPKHLTQGQKDAVALVLTTKDQFVGVNGVAGSGKTTMMETLKALAEAKGYHLVGIAPTHKAVQMLGESMNRGQFLKDAGIPVMTAHSFIGQQQTQYNDKTIFIVDECSMLGNRLYNNIQKKMMELNTRAVFAGDIGQHAAIEHGKPQELAIDHGLKIARMNEIVRQSTEQLKASAVFASQKDSEASLRNLESINPNDYIERTGNYAVEDYKESFIEIGIDRDLSGEPIYTAGGFPSIDNLYNAVANDWLSRTPEQREQTIVVACMHTFRNEIDARIRDGLKAEGIIHSSVKTHRLVSKNFDTVDLLLAKNYQPDDIIRFDKTFSIAKKGDHMRVTGIKTQENKLEITNVSDGNTYTINPAKLAIKAEMSVYDEVKAELGLGDRIRLRMSDKTKGWIGGAEYKIKDIAQGKAHLENNTGSLVINLKDKKDQLWDYAYTHTSYSVQGASSKYMIGLEINDNYRSNYIQITRAKEHLNIYTIDKKWLIDHLTSPEKMQKADKVSAYEVMESGKVEAQQKDSINETEKGLVSQKITSELSDNQAVSLDAYQAHNDEIMAAYDQEKSSKSVINTPIKQSPKTYNNRFEVKTKPVLAADIKPLLNAKIEALALALLGEPNKKLSNKTQLRYGSKGSLSINTTTGGWYSHETGEKGNAFDLIQKEMGMADFKDVLNYAKQFVNYTPEMVMPTLDQTPKISCDDQVHKDKINAYAQKLFKASQPLSGTLGEKYLKTHRGLNHYHQADIRFLPKVSGYNKKDQRIYTPAILSFAKNDQGQINHIQIVRLDEQGHKNKHVKIAKQTYGKMQGLAVELSPRANNHCTYLSEGVETGLSLLNVKPKAHVMAVLGVSNFKNIQTNLLADKVIICLDNDFKAHPDQKKIAELKTRSAHFKAVVERLNAEGKQVRFVLPNHNGFDFNDVLKHEGHVALSKQLNEIITEKDHQKITEKYIEKIEKGQELAIEKIILSVKKQETHIKNIVNMTPKVPTEHAIINPNIDHKTQQHAQSILQKDVKLSRTNRQLDHKIMTQYGFDFFHGAAK